MEQDLTPNNIYELIGLVVNYIQCPPAIAMDALIINQYDIIAAIIYIN